MVVSIKMIVKYKSIILKLLAKINNLSKCIGVVPYTTLKEKVEQIYPNALWLTPESLESTLRFDTHTVLSSTKIFVVGTDIFTNPYRAPMFDFSLFRVHIYNPLIDIIPIKLENEDWLFEEIFSKKINLYSSVVFKNSRRVFFIASSRHDMLEWYGRLRKKFENLIPLTGSLPARLVCKVISETGYPILCTKDVAFKYSKSEDCLVKLPNIHRIKESKLKVNSLDCSDMCLIFGFEKRINTSQALVKIIPKYYEYTSKNVATKIKELISLGLLHQFPSRILSPTLLGKTVIRNFLTVFTTKIFLKLDETSFNIPFQLLPEFFQEKWIEEKLYHLQGSLRELLELESIRKKVWITNALLQLSSVTKRFNLFNSISEIRDELKERKDVLMKNFVQKIGV
jgi:hypothetical protein